MHYRIEVGEQGHFSVYVHGGEGIPWTSWIPGVHWTTKSIPWLANNHLPQSYINEGLDVLSVISDELKERGLLPH